MIAKDIPNSFAWRNCLNCEHRTVSGEGTIGQRFKCKKYILNRSTKRDACPCMNFKLEPLPKKK